MALFPWNEPVTSKDGQTFGIYMWADILVSCFSDSLNLVEFRQAKLFKNPSTDLYKGRCLAENM